MQRPPKAASVISGSTLVGSAHPSMLAQLGSDSLIASMQQLPIPKAGTLTDAIQGLSSRSQMRLRDQQAEDSRERGIGGSGGVNTLGGGRFDFPSDPTLWSALVVAVKAEKVSQQPPLYVLNDGDSGEAVYVNQRFLQDFLEKWEEQDTHTISISPALQISTEIGANGGTVGGTNSSSSMRTFRAHNNFWFFVLDFNEHHVLRQKEALGRKSAMNDDLEGLVVRTDKPLPPRNSIGNAANALTSGPSVLFRAQGMSYLNQGQKAGNSARLGAIGEVRMSKQQWIRLVKLWDAKGSEVHKGKENVANLKTGVTAPTPAGEDKNKALNEKLSDDVSSTGAGGASYDGSNAGTDDIFGDGYYDAEGNLVGGGKPDMTGLPAEIRRRSGAVIDPMSTVPDVTEMYQLRWRNRTNHGVHHSAVQGGGAGGTRQQSAYFTHFMKHWKLLEAQYRNYL